MTERARWLLALDTSTERAGVALTDGRSLAELGWDAHRRQSVTLARGVDHLLELADVSRDQLGAVAVTIGPGTFNGLRVGIGFAKGLAWGLDCPIIGVPTLDAVALTGAGPGRLLVTVVGAGRGRFVWSVYAPPDREAPLEANVIAAGSLAGWRATPPTNGTSARLVAELGQLGCETTLTGEVSDELDAALDPFRDVGGWVTPPLIRERRPAAVAALGWDRWTENATDDLVTLTPIYLHGTAHATESVHRSATT